jgi:mycothiol system anti-sigma-R factor
MNCQNARDRLEALLDGELGADEAAALRAHLRTCPACAERLVEAETLRPLVRRALQRHVAPAGLADDLRRRLARERRPARPWWGALAAGIAVLATGFGWWLHAVLLPSAAPSLAKDSERYVYHINNSDRADAVLQNIHFHLEARPQAQFVVVTHNEGIDFLLKGAIDRRGTAFAPRVAALAARGVQFRVCNNTLNARHIPPAQVIAQAQLVPSGIAEVGRLQTQEGYAYLKP